MKTERKHKSVFKSKPGELWKCTINKVVYLRTDVPLDRPGAMVRRSGLTLHPPELLVLHENDWRFYIGPFRSK